MSNLFITSLTLILILFTFSCSESKQDFYDSGVQKTATITEIGKSTKRIGKKMIRSSSYYMKVTFFTVGDTVSTGIEEDTTLNKYKFLDKLKTRVTTGDMINTEIGISKEQSLQYKKGDRVPIIYLPNEPNKIILDLAD